MATDFQMCGVASLDYNASGNDVFCYVSFVRTDKMAARRTLPARCTHEHVLDILDLEQQDDPEDQDSSDNEFLYDINDDSDEIKRQ